MCDGGHRCPSARSVTFASSCLTWLCLRSLSIVESTTQFFDRPFVREDQRSFAFHPHLRRALQVPFSYKKWDSALPREPRTEETNIGYGHVLYKDEVRRRPRVVPALAEFQVCAPGQCLFCERKTKLIFYCT